MNQSNGFTYQFPQSDALIGNNHLWVILQPMKINASQKAGGRTTIPADNDGPTFKLMLPDQFAISLTHRWEPYESMTARLAETLAKYYKVATQLKGIYGTVIDYGGLNKIMSEKNKEEIVYTRIDSPLVYKESAPLEYNLNFEFVVNKPSDGDYLHEMIKDLMELSCPIKPGEGTTLSSIRVEPPHIFKVTTTANNKGKSILKMSGGAITTIQPTFAAPYRNGTSFKVGLTISIVDITPLFAQNITEGGSVTVGRLTTTPPGGIAPITGGIDALVDSYSKTGANLNTNIPIEEEEEEESVPPTQSLPTNLSSGVSVAEPVNQTASNEVSLGGKG
jgi:hypothetical protein